MIGGMPTRFWNAVKKAKDLYGRYRFIVGIGLLLVSGVGFAIGGTVWLISAGVPLPLALMAGYCTLVGAIYLTMAPFVYRVISIASSAPASAIEMPASATEIKTDDQTPNLEAVRLQHQYTLGSASKLWVNLDASANPTYDSKSWLETFMSAIQQKKLRFLPRNAATAQHEQQTPDSGTIVTRQELQRYAKIIGQDPPFLRDA
jgi:hypothetical protein